MIDVLPKLDSCYQPDGQDPQHYNCVSQLIQRSLKTSTAVSFYDHVGFNSYELEYELAVYGCNGLRVVGPCIFLTK